MTLSSCSSLSKKEPEYRAAQTASGLEQVLGRPKQVEPAGSGQEKWTYITKGRSFSAGAAQGMRLGFKVGSFGQSMDDNNDFHSTHATIQTLQILGVITGDLTGLLVAPFGGLVGLVVPCKEKERLEVLVNPDRSLDSYSLSAGEEGVVSRGSFS